MEVCRGHDGAEGDLRIYTLTNARTFLPKLPQEPPAEQQKVRLGTLGVEHPPTVDCPRRLVEVSILIPCTRVICSSMG